MIGGGPILLVILEVLIGPQAFLAWSRSMRFARCSHCLGMPTVRTKIWNWDLSESPCLPIREALPLMPRDNCHTDGGRANLGYLKTSIIRYTTSLARSMARSCLS